MTPPVSRFSLRVAMLVAGLSAVSFVLMAGGPSPAVTARTEVDAAYAKLGAMPHRKRETVLGAAAAAGMKPMVTDVVGNRTRLVYEVDVPRFGRIRSEMITVGSRRAARTIAPGIQDMITKAKTKATVSSVRSLLKQIMSVAAAIQTGGLSTAQTIQQVVNAAATMKTVADARRVLGEAEEAFNAWHEVKDDIDAELEAEYGPMAPVGSTSLGMDISFVGLQETKRGTMRKYLRRPPGGFPGMPELVETLLISVETGLPMSEEMVMNGQPMMRVDYLDHGAAITIDIPECLR